MYTELCLFQVTDEGNELAIDQVDGTTCVIPADLTHTSWSNASVAYKGYIDLTSETPFCAHVVVVNLCPNSTTFTLRVKLPVPIDYVRHEFQAVYNVSLSHNGSWSLWLDTLPGYQSAVYKLGC